MRDSLKNIAIKNNTLSKVTFEVTQHCNWKCKHCYLASKKERELTYDEIRELLLQMREMGVYSVVFTGGEMFLRKDIMKIIEESRKLYYEVTLLTNGSLLNEKIIAQLKEMYISEISVTMFSMNPKVHDSITGIIGSHEKLMYNIKLIKKYKLSLEIKTILLKDNYKDYIEIRKFCDENGFNYRVSTHVHEKHNGDNCTKKLHLSNEQMVEVIGDITKIMNLTKREHGSEKYICTSSHYSIAINAYGDVYPCLNMPIVVGNVRHDSLKKIWYDSEKMNMFKNMRWKDLQECNDCNKKNKCFRCSGMSYLESGNFLNKNTMDCEFTKLSEDLIC